MSIINHHVTTSPNFRIRSHQTSSEIETFFRLNAQVFRPDEDTDLVAAYRHRYITEEPDFRPSQLRGAFLGETYVGGYILLERWQCLGSARICTGCISGVVTHPDYRHARDRNSSDAGCDQLCSKPTVCASISSWLAEFLLSIQLH